ncbi:MAG: ribbon-helix-helix domain-containing protein [Candidatus Zixiibacteriota bacterium]
MKRNKKEIVTFKADESLLDAMKGIPNRSEFIRSAVMHALDSVCPLCRGTGILTPNQRNHWKDFASNHRIEECLDCHEMHIVCEHQNENNSK